MKSGNLSIQIKLALLFFALSNIFYATAQADGTSLDQVKAFNLREGKANNAAMEVFFKLRDKFGQRLRTTGALIYCKKPELAAEIQPSMFELMSESLDILDNMNLSEYGITDNSDKPKIYISRRAVTAASTYMFSADEHAQTVTKLLPDHSITLCKTALKSYDEIMSTLQ